MQRRFIEDNETVRTYRKIYKRTYKTKQKQLSPCGHHVIREDQGGFGCSAKQVKSWNEEGHILGNRDRTEAYF